MYVRQCKWTLLPTPPHPTPPHPVNPMKDIETCKTLVRFSTRRLKNPRHDLASPLRMSGSSHNVLVRVPGASRGMLWAARNSDPFRDMSVPWKQAPSRTQCQWYVPPGSLGVGCTYCVTLGWISASDPTQPKGPPQISQREGSFAPTLHANFRLCASWWHRHGAGIASHVVLDFALGEPITSTWLGTSWDAFDQLSQHMESNPST